MSLTLFLCLLILMWIIWAALSGFERVSAWPDVRILKRTAFAGAAVMTAIAAFLVLSFIMEGARHGGL